MGNIKRLRDLADMKRMFNIYLIRIPEREDRDNGEK